MAISESRNTDDTRRLAEASAWRVRLSEVGLDSSEAFEIWLAGDPRNGHAWQDLQALWEHFEENATSPEIMAARRDALHRARRQARKTIRWSPGSVGIAASIAAMLLSAGVLVWAHNRPEVYRTSIGERRMLTLADGSKITLDSASQVEVRLSKDARKLALREGQARFDVAHDVQRPFSVRARDRTIVATGTTFDVDVLGPTVRVTLIEGHVVVLDNRHDDQSRSTSVGTSTMVEMHTGQQLVASTIGPPQITSVSLEKETAWESGQIIVDNETLISVAERISRYSSKPVVVIDPNIAQLRLSGVFNAGDIDTFVDTVTRYLPVEAIGSKEGQINLRHRR
jgi:transmembrane sensor